MESLFAWSCSATSCLNDASISSLKEVLFFSSIFRKSSCENVDTVVDSTFVMDAVADVLFVSCVMEDECFFFLFSMVGNEVSFSMSYDARMWRL